MGSRGKAIHPSSERPKESGRKGKEKKKKGKKVVGELAYGSYEPLVTSQT